MSTEALPYEWYEDNHGGPALVQRTVADVEADEARGQPYWVGGDDTVRTLGGRVYWE